MLLLLLRLADVSGVFSSNVQKTILDLGYIFSWKLIRIEYLEYTWLLNRTRALSSSCIHTDITFPFILSVRVVQNERGKTN